MKAKLALLILLTITACGGSGSSTTPATDLPDRWESLPIPIAVTDNDRDTRAIELFNGYFGYDIFVADAEGVLIVHTDAMPDGCEDAYGCTTREYSDDFITDAVIYIDTSLTGDDTALYACALEHEMGHVLGAGHIGTTLMAAAVNCDGGFFGMMNDDDTFPDWLRNTYELEYREPVFPE